MAGTKRGIAVNPLGREAIRAVAAEVRKLWGMHEMWFPIAEFVEKSLSTLHPKYVFHVVSVLEMGSQHGMTIPDQGIILIREDVYERAMDGEGRDRFTIAHEFGHLLLHRGIPMARGGFTGIHPHYVDSEWQADTFAGELLVSVEFADQYQNPGGMAPTCGVSMNAAGVMYQQLEKEGLLKKKRI